MKTNKLDNSIKEKLQNRTLEPSASAWERLSAQLDAQPKQKKKGWFFYIGAAASILLLVSIGFQLLSDTKKEIKTNKIIVDTLIDTLIINQKIEHSINEAAVEIVIVENEKTDKKSSVKKIIATNSITNKSKNVISAKEQHQTNRTNVSVLKEESNHVIAKVEKAPEVHPTKEKIIQVKYLKQDPNSSIKINSDDLLFAVTHSSKEVKAYYAKQNLTREDVLKTIKNELKKSNIKINPNTILAEVERTIGEEDFDNNFLKSLKKRVTDIATAIASRNN